MQKEAFSFGTVPLDRNLDILYSLHLMFSGQVTQHLSMFLSHIMPIMPVYQRRPPAAISTSGGVLPTTKYYYKTCAKSNYVAPEKTTTPMAGRQTASVVSRTKP